MLQIVIEEPTPGSVVFHISSCRNGNDPWTQHVAGQVKLDAPQEEHQVALADLRANHNQQLDVEAFYSQQRERGFGYGPAFQGIDSLYKGNNQALARLEAPTSLDDAPEYRFHPAS